MRVDDATQERQLVAGEQRGQLVAGQERRCGDWTRERRTERLAWIHGGAVNTRHRNRDKIGSSEEESQDV